MDGESSERIRALFQIAREDARYRELSRQYAQLEAAFARLVQSLPEDEQDAAWAFVCTSEEMNWRMLEILSERFGWG